MTDENNDAKEQYSGPSGSPEPTVATESCRNDASGAVCGLISAYTIFGPQNTDRRPAADRFYLAPAVGFLVGMVLALVAFVLYKLDVAVPAVAAVVILLLLVIMKFTPFGDLADHGNKLAANNKNGAAGFGLAISVTLVVFACMFSLDMMMLSVIWPLEVIAKNAPVAVARYAKQGSEATAAMLEKTDQSAMIKSLGLSIVLALIALIICGVVYYCVTYENMFSTDMIVTAVMAVLIAAVIAWLVGWFVANRANGRSEAVEPAELGAANEIARALILIVFIVLSAGVAI